MKNKVVCCLAGLAGLIFLLWHSPQISVDPPPIQEGKEAGTETANVPANPVPTERAAQGESSDVLPLAKRQDLLWEEPVTEPAFAAFKEWVGRYQEAATPEAKAALETEGVELGRARRRAIGDLIQNNPEQALALAVPRSVRSEVPAAVAALLEQDVNARGDFQVLAVTPLPNSTTQLPPVVRGAMIGGESYEVFTYGKGLTYVTRRDVPLNGIAIEVEAASEPPTHSLLARRKLMALNPSPGRVLEARELATALKAEPICAASGKETGMAVQMASEIRSFCVEAHAAQWVGAAAAGLDEPAGDPGTVLTAASSYSEGRKRMLLMRPIWTDYSGGMTTNDAVTHFQSFSNYMYEMSQGQLVLAALGRGSDITPSMLLPGSVAQYDDTGLGSLFNTSRSVAESTYGYDLSQYDFTYVCTGSRPSADYAGLGFVGSPGFHLANSSWGSSVSSHEFGHNLGLSHAHFWDTDRKSIIGPGQNVEYGDGDDPMGNGGSPNSYNSRYRQILGWIPDTDIVDLNAAGSGQYRLYAFDLNNSSGLRGLKFRRNASQNYWVQFRQRIPGEALANGVQLLWTGNGNEGSYLLDVRIKGVSDNNAVVIGRTFSDPLLNMHITPLGKGHTSPESMDVRVNIGPFPGNQAPSVTASANLTTAAVGQTVTFTATASDPNGDALAYFWEFNDGEYSVDNSAVTTHSFGAAGEYTAHCTASDMKGATARHTVLVRVGNPATFRISGRVLDGANRPLGGIHVRTDSGRVAFTDRDGSYTITGLGGGSYSLDAVEPLNGSLSFVHPTFNNPVRVGPNFVGADLVGVSSALVVSTALQGKGATGWKYRDNGVDQGTAWRQPLFDDASWTTGRAPLGYPSGTPVNTLINFGPNSSSKYITYYFRRPFVVANPSAYLGVNLEVLRDDGVVVYVNGTEVFRNNLPTGTIGFNTTASSRIDADAYILASMNGTLLVPGTNVIAAEVHQADGSSSDAVMDVAVNGQSVSVAGGLRFLYVSSPPDRSRITTPTNLTLTANGYTTVGSIALVEFFANGSKLGEASAAPYAFTWINPATNNYTLTAVATVSGGASLTSAPTTIAVALPPVPTVVLTSPTNGADFPIPTNLLLQATVNAAGAVISAVQFFVDGALAGEDPTAPYSFSFAGLTAGARALTAVARTSVGNTYTSSPVNVTLVAPSAGTQLVSFGEVWKYLDDGSNQGTNWFARVYDDRLWAAGPARLGYGGDGEATAVSSGLGVSGRPVTAYFRKTFVVPDPSLFAGLLLRLTRDDGAVVYLNGVELFRDNLGSGLVSWNSLATTSVEGPAELAVLEARVPSSLLVTGTNLVAVEIHQVNTGSTDLGLDLALIGLRTTAPSQVYLTQPADGARFVGPTNVLLTLYPGAGPAPGSVTYRANGAFLGLGALTAPYAFVWSNAPVGTHSLVAVADFASQLLSSAPVTVTVSARPSSIQPVFTNIVTAGSAWRYWDSAQAVGAGWAATNFNDTSWPSGPARFGWGLDGERTTLTEARVTTYFRRWFALTNADMLSEMVFHLVRDDGAVVYLNGRELFRSNMPGGTVTANTLSLTGVSTPEETTFLPTTLSVSGSGLLSGSNLVAVEIHQGSATSSDGGFDLQLSLFGTTEPRVYLTLPREGSVYSGSANTVSLEAIARGVAGANVTSVEFFANGEKIGEGTAAPWQLTWSDVPLGLHVLTARSRDATGVVVDSPPVSINVGRSILTTTLIPTNSSWKYLVTGANQGTNWASRTFNDNVWPSGAALLGYGTDGEQTTIGYGGNANAKYITTYFRKTFVVPLGAVYTNLEFRLVRDDGAVVWLNGRQLFRSNMPAGTITYQTLASQTADAAEEQTPFLTSIAVTNLPSGTNVVAVEVHQATANSSDLGFNLELSASGYLDVVPPPRLSIEMADGAVELSWVNTTPGYRVLEAPSLATPAASWTVSSGTLVELPGRFVFTTPTPTGLRFYRLSKP